MSIRLKSRQPLDPSRPLPLGLRFYALTTSPKREFAVAHWLEEQGWFSLIPLIYRQRQAKRHGARRNVERGKVEMPLIPRIVVAGLPFAPSAHALADGYWHITGVLGVAGEPMAMRYGEVERLRETSAVLMMPKPELVLKAGDKARMPVPGFGSELKVVEIKSITGKYASIIQSWFGVEREIHVHVDSLEAA